MSPIGNTFHAKGYCKGCIGGNVGEIDTHMLTGDSMMGSAVAAQTLKTAPMNRHHRLIFMLLSSYAVADRIFNKK